VRNEQYYIEAVQEYRNVNKEISNRIINLSLTIIASIFVICNQYNITKTFIWSLLFFVVTIALHISGNICYSKHYELFLDEKIDKIDFRKSIWGRSAERLYWWFISFFAIATIVYLVALFQTIDKIGP
jgi:hypothetical protein